jgi:hypothetical protein
MEGNYFTWLCFAVFALFSYFAAFTTASCFVRAYESLGSGILRLTMMGVQLKNTEGFGVFRKSDPFFEISKQIDSAGGHTW